MLTDYNDIILNDYLSGLSINYIANCIYKSVNKNRKPVIIANGKLIFNNKISKKECREYIYNLILEYKKTEIPSI